MAYADRAALIARYGETELAELLAYAGEDAALQEAALAAVLEDVETEINSYLVKRVALPLDPIPSSLRRAACDMARWRLYRTHAPDDAATRHRDAVSWLSRIAKGELGLGAAPAAETAPSSPGAPAILLDDAAPSPLLEGYL